MTNDEATKKIRKAAEDGKVIFSSQDGVESFDDAFVDAFLSECVGVKSAWISDASGLSDFGERGEEAYAKIEEKYGVDVRGKDNLLEIFRIIHATNRTQQ